MSELPPDVSVVIPTYNYAHFIGQALGSLQLQALAAWECIIVDDGSVDDTGLIVSSIARSDPRIRYVRQENRGLSAARNAGILAARGRYLQLLDADDALQPRKLAAHAAYLDSHPECDIVVGGWAYWDGNADLAQATAVEPIDLAGSGRAVQAVLLRGNAMSVNAPLMRMTAVHRTTLFDERLSAMEDWEYWLRHALVGHAYAVMRARDTLALVRQHGTSMSRDRELMLRSEVAVRLMIKRQLTKRWQRRLNQDLLGDAEIWLGTRMGVHGSLLRGMRTVLRGAIRRRRLLPLLRLPMLAVAATPPGRLLGARLWPRLFRSGHPAGRPIDTGQSVSESGSH